MIVADLTHGGVGRRRAGELSALRHIAPRQRLAYQHVQGLLAHHGRPVFAGELGDQGDVLLIAAHRVPGEPNAVGRAQLARRVQLGQLLSRERELSVRCRTGVLLLIGVVIAVDHQTAADWDRVAIQIVEVDPAAESPRGFLARFRVDRTGPDRRHLGGPPFAGGSGSLVLTDPRNLLGQFANGRQIQGLASRETDQNRDGSKMCPGHGSLSS